MKKSYKKIICFEIIMSLILLLNSFNSSILRLYRLPFFLLLGIIIFNFLLKMEKDRYNYKEDVCLEIIKNFIIFIIIYYLFGIFIGFAKVDKYYSINSLVFIIIPLILTIITKEILRYSLLKKTEKSKLLVIITVLLFIFIDYATTSSIVNFNSSMKLFKYIALIFLPSISTNIFLSYLTLKFGYKPSILYSLLFSLYPYLFYIIPNPSEYIKSIIDLIIPFIFMYSINRMFKKIERLNDDVTINNKKVNYIFYLIPIVFMIINVYFVSGYFRFYSIAIASGSMNPIFDRGAVVIVDQKYKKIKKGDIIAFKAENKVVVHRVIKKINSKKESYYYTKGDANNYQDNYEIKNKDIIGTVKFYIPFLGYPTIWFSEL